MKLVECVPNFSEGRDRRVLDTIAEAVRSVEGVSLLDVDPGAATNRTVFTFVGPIDAIEEAAVRAIARAADRIDMTRHQGAHPRMGATDVCPFVPIGETTMEECVALARRVGERVAAAHALPVYLYEEAATAPHRRSLAAIRQGEYEGLAAKMKDPQWAPDFGPAEFNPRLGATAVGAREFLIAYNVNLNTRDRRLANAIAQNVRETGRPRRGPDGRVLRDASGALLTEPGDAMLPTVRATGWYIDEYDRAQVSMNLTNYRVTPPHAAFEAVDAEARKRGVRVTGSEIVGLIPLKAVTEAGRFYLDRQGRTAGVAERALVATAVVSLGLAECSPFEPEKKIVEYRVAASRPLASMSVERFSEQVGDRAPVPGGGSVAALLGALAAGLSAMVAALSFEKKALTSHREDLGRAGEEAQACRARLLNAIDDDARAFDGVMAAARLPRRDEADRRHREEAMQEATREAIRVPLRVMEDSLRALELAAVVAEKGAPAALSDAGVAALAAGAALEGAAYNVMINLDGLTDRPEADRFRAQAESLRRKADPLARGVAERVTRAFEAAGQSSPEK